jgi:hypothetical protein
MALDVEQIGDARPGDEVEEEPVEDVEAPAQPGGEQDEPLVAGEAEDGALAGDAGVYIIRRKRP